MKRRGTVLIQVLMTALVVSIIAAGLLHLVQLRTTAVARSEAGAKAGIKALGYYNVIIAAWARSPGIVCRNVPGFTGGNQSSPPGACGCSYATPDGLTITTALHPENCNIHDSGCHCQLTIPANP